jgi:leucyl aminopeptidase
MRKLNTQLSYAKVSTLEDSRPQPSEPTGTVLVIGACQNTETSESAPKIVASKGVKAQKELAPIYELLSKTPQFSPKSGSLLTLLHCQKTLETYSKNYSHLVGFGVGKASDCTPQNILSWGGRLASEFKNLKVTSVDIYVDSLYQAPKSVSGEDAPKDFAGRPLLERVMSREEFLEKLATGILLGSYTFDRYKSQPSEKDAKKAKKDTPPLLVRFLSTQLDGRKIATLLEEVEIICEGVYLVRDLQTTPGGDMVPEEIAKQARLAGQASGYQTTVWDEKKIKAEGMNGIISVGQGSDNPPRFIQMEINANKKNLPTVVLVGKGISFDTGGYCLKPGAGMEEMKMDMSGSASVIGAMSILARLKAPVHAIGLVASAENMVSGRATRPGDIYTAHDGQTVEVINTDAEGRLVLADALSYAASLEPDCVIDVATLTGAVVIALGYVSSGMMGNDAKLLEAVKSASNIAGERVWELPLYPEYKEGMKSKTADYRNIGTDRGAGSQLGGTFLNFFVKNKYPWVHLDVAATADTPRGQGPHCPADVGTGVPTRSLVEFCRNFAADFKKRK